MSAVILIVGSRGTGKSFTAKEILSKVHPDARLILDVQGEYKDLFPRDPIKFEHFEKLMGQVKNAVILIEEATIFLSNRGYNNNVVDLLVDARHSNNTIIMVYHSLRSVPYYIFELSNIVYLLKTGDNPDEVKRKFQNDQLTDAVLRLKKSPNLKNPTTGREYSPRIAIKLY